MIGKKINTKERNNRENKDSVSVIAHEWEAASLYCFSVVASVNRKPMKRRKKQVAKHSTNSAGFKTE